MLIEIQNRQKSVLLLIEFVNIRWRIYPKTKHREKLLNVIMILGVLHRSKKPMMMLKSRRIE